MLKSNFLSWNFGSCKYRLYICWFVCVPHCTCNLVFRYFWMHVCSSHVSICIRYPRINWNVAAYFDASANFHQKYIAIWWFICTFDIGKIYESVRRIQHRTCGSIDPISELETFSGWCQLDDKSQETYQFYSCPSTFRKKQQYASSYLIYSNLCNNSQNGPTLQDCN
jgi:hypothetical protein